MVYVHSLRRWDVTTNLGGWNLNVVFVSEKKKQNKKKKNKKKKQQKHIRRCMSIRKR